NRWSWARCNGGGSLGRLAARRARGRRRGAGGGPRGGRAAGGRGPPRPQTQATRAAVLGCGPSEPGGQEAPTSKTSVAGAQGRSEGFAEIAAEFVALKVNVIVTSGGVVPTVKQATSTIPIVFAAALDPVASGYVASLARPGGNITGLSLQSTDTVGKRLGFLR